MKKLLGLVFLVGASAAFAEEGGQNEILMETIKNNGAYLKYFAYFLAMGLAALGGTSGQGRAAAAALEGICRNPAAADKVTTPMILSFAFMESLVIFTLISIFLT